METRKTDRRVKYTKSVLRQALIELLQDSHISKISITNLCKSADVNRATFYSHYSDQFDLLAEIERDVYAELQSYVAMIAGKQSDGENTNYFRHITAYAAQNADIFRILLGQNGTMQFHKDILQIAQKTANPSGDWQGEQYDRRSEYFYLYAVTGCISVLKKWLDDGVVESSDEMADIIYSLLQPGVNQYQQNSLLE